MTDATHRGWTWNDLAAVFPEFVQWAVATHGPLPDGDIQQADYERLKTEYEETA